MEETIQQAHISRNVRHQSAQTACPEKSWNAIRHTIGAKIPQNTAFPCQMRTKANIPCVYTVYPENIRTKIRKNRKYSAYFRLSGNSFLAINA